MSMVATKRSILDAAKNLKRGSLSCPALGGVVHFRELTAGERDRFWDAQTRRDGDETTVNLIDAGVRLIAIACTDQDGKALFAESDIADLRGLPAAAVGELADAIREVSGMGPASEERAEKN